jgi:GNAT superfamily N-acetyltransferase
MNYRSEIGRAVTAYDPADKSLLRLFQQEYFGADSRQCSDEFSDWLFERNPHRESGEPVLWVCKRDGIVVGQQASIPVSLKIGDEYYRAAWGTDLMVHPQWRLKGVGPALVGAQTQTRDIVLGMGLSDAAYKNHMRAGWTDMDRLPIFVRPLDPAPCLQAFGAHRLLGALMPRMLFDGSARVISHSMRAATGLCLERVPAFDEQVETLWTQASRSYRILVKRDFASVRWRFDEIPQSASYQRYYLSRRGKLVGYAVVRAKPFRGHTAAWVIDHLCEPGRIGGLFALLIAEMSRQRYAAMFIEQLHQRAHSTLRALGCARVAAGSRFVLHVRDGAAVQADGFKDAADWLVTCADSDVDHARNPGEPDIEAISAPA